MERITPKRIAIFAHYDKNSVIDDYVIFYLKALKEVAEKIIFVSDGNLPLEEQNKLDGIADKIIAQKHGEYDFGSYKRGFLYVLENSWLNDIDECIFANDSCYGPFRPLGQIFEQMTQKECDFWGITENKNGMTLKEINMQDHSERHKKYSHCKKAHLQSYFLVLKKGTFSSEVFLNFINSIKFKENKNDIIIDYEIGLSQMLVNTGFKYDYLINPKFKSFNYSIYKWKKILLECNMPFLKCSLPRLENMKCIAIDGYREVIKRISDYPIDLIDKNVQRTSSNRDYLRFIPALLRPYFYKIIYALRKRYLKFKLKKFEKSDKK